MSSLILKLIEDLNLVSNYVAGMCCNKLDSDVIKFHQELPRIENRLIAKPVNDN